MSGPDAVGLLLGAGAASRFGAPKQIAAFRGAPLISWPLAALHAGGLERVLVVLGCHHEQVAAAIPGAETILAADWAEGLSASLRAGVAAAEALGAARVVVALADQPLLHPHAVARVLAQSRAGTAIVRADYGDAAGHPTALARATFAAVAQLRGDAGARRLTGFALRDVPCAGLGSAADIDTPADLARWSAAVASPPTPGSAADDAGRRSQTNG